MKRLYILVVSTLAISLAPFPVQAKEKIISNTTNTQSVSNQTDSKLISQMPNQGYQPQGQPTMQNPQGAFYQQYQQQPQPPILANGQVLVTTTDSVPGFRVVEYKGIVRGDVVFGPTILQSFKSSIKSIIGGRIGGFTQMCQRARQNAFEDMLNQARQLGANAVVGVQYDSSTFSTSSDSDVGTEVFCYGTAVRIDPL